MAKNLLKSIMLQNLLYVKSIQKSKNHHHHPFRLVKFKKTLGRYFFILHMLVTINYDIYLIQNKIQLLWIPFILFY
jgi:hypothetical protein